MTLSPCIECGEPSNGPRCDDHQLRAAVKPSSVKRGYDWTWQQLSTRARRLQPFCTDCHTTDDLTTDHSEEAWKRKAAGKVIRLKDVDVVCRGCNSKRGKARPTGERALDDPLDPTGQADFQSHLGIILNRGAQ